MSMKPGERIPETTIWIDLVEPTRDEDRQVEEHLTIQIPTRDEMSELEPSSLLYAENGARYMTARIIFHSDTATPKLVLRSPSS